MFSFQILLKLAAYAGTRPPSSFDHAFSTLSQASIQVSCLIALETMLWLTEWPKHHWETVSNAIVGPRNPKMVIAQDSTVKHNGPKLCLFILEFQFFKNHPGSLDIENEWGRKYMLSRTMRFPRPLLIQL